MKTEHSHSISAARMSAGLVTSHSPTGTAYARCTAVNEFFPTSTLGPMEEITGPTANQTSNVARGSEMKISIGVTGISISSETFQLMDYLVWAD